MKHRITGENSIPALAIHNETTFYNLPQQTSQEFPSNPPLHIPNNSPCWIRIPRRYKSSLHCAKRFPFPHNFLRHENFKDARRGIENERLQPIPEFTRSPISPPRGPTTRIRKCLSRRALKKGKERRVSCVIHETVQFAKWHRKFKIRRRIGNSFRPWIVKGRLFAGGQFEPPFRNG